MTDPQGKSPKWTAIAEVTRSPDWPTTAYAPLHRELYLWENSHWVLLAAIGPEEPRLQHSNLYVSKSHRSSCPRPPGRGIARRLGLLPGRTEAAPGSR